MYAVNAARPLTDVDVEDILEIVRTTLLSAFFLITAL